MGEQLLNGRAATEAELAAIDRGRQCDRDRDLELLAGVLTGDPPKPGHPRPVTDIVWEFS